MRVVFAYKNFAANRNISHIGLGVAALNTSKVLRRAGYDSVVWPILSADDLANQLRKAPADQVIISAPWIPSAELLKLSNEFSGTHFSVICHSNVGFLQADRNGTKLLRETIDLELSTHNIHVGGNSQRFCQWIQDAFDAPCAYTPNLYYIDDSYAAKPNLYTGGPLRIGLFGATRPLKNLMTATGAAIQIARQLRAPLDLWLSAGRAEGGGETVLAAVKEMVQGMPNVNLLFNGWATWPQFRKLVGSMDLLISASYTESFNMVTADGIAESVASVTSPAINWVPDSWQVDSDDTSEIATIGRMLVFDPRATADGLAALRSYVADGLVAYKTFFASCK